jgi:hypothetical protein
VTAAAGDEYLGRGGFLFRATASGTYAMVDLFKADASRINFTLNLAFGIKLS